MNIKIVCVAQDLEELISKIDSCSSKNTEIHVEGSLYNDLSKTYTAYGKCRFQVTAGKLGILGGALAFFGSLITAPLTYGTSILAGTVTFITSIAGASNALNEFQTSAYADEVFILGKHGFRVIRNDGKKLILGR
jgi:hypothetical protein